jgi:lipopolysaccharide/colanic/teichoic acid biosynthesis glycosyltransferase
VGTASISVQCLRKDALEKLRYDLYYVKNQSFLLDLIILLQTAEVVIWQKGSR